MMKNHTIRMTDAEWEKCQLMGGAAWIREKINAEDIRIKEGDAKWDKEKKLLSVIYLNGNWGLI